jgi:hypothetical protein
LIIAALGFSIWLYIKKNADNTKLEPVAEAEPKQVIKEDLQKENPKKNKKK